jgi:sigma-B regulation protein RsbU (phosphoserine phosphatase)
LKAKAYSDAVKEQMASELRIAREIQLGILPADISSCTEGTGLDIQVVLEAAKEVGGDLYEVLRTDDGRIVVVVGDVSGKGIPAALFMAVTMTLVRTIARQFKKPEEIVLQVSDALEAHNPRAMFVTFTCAVFDWREGRVTCANAGHPSPVLLRDGNAPSMPLQPTAMVAGVFPGMEVTVQAMELQPGDTLVFYTDGVIEAFNASGEMFGEDRLLAHLGKQTGTTAKGAVDSMLSAVRQHAGGHSQSDDITVLAVRFDKVPTIATQE